MSVDWADPKLALLAALACAHVGADFLTRASARAQRSPSALRRFLVVALSLALLAWLRFPGSPNLVLVGLIAFLSAVLSCSRDALDKARPRQTLWWLLGEQALQLVVVWGAWLAWEVPRDQGGARFYGQAAVILAVLLFNSRLAAEIVSRTLAQIDDVSEQKPEDRTATTDGPDGAGRLIGILERWIVVGLVSGNQWGAVGLVLTAKSIARFKKMDEQAFAEIYLVGTMTSVLIAMASGGLLRLLLA